MSRPEAGAAASDDATTRRMSEGSSKRVASPDLSGRTLGEFRLLRRLGSGGMGDVYLAEQTSLKRQVALKVLRPDLAANSVYCRRFEVEATAAAKLNHPSIVQIYAVGEADGLRYMALEYVRGMNLRDFVAKKGPLNTRLALRAMQQVAAALHRAGEQGIVHRDIKPDNIMLTRHGEVKVADFGLARSTDTKPMNLTRSGVTLGTPLYMSPEQVEGKEVDPRSDLYSLGVTCYHMLTGQPPFRGETVMAIALKHIKADPEPLDKLRPDLPAALVRIVQKLMAKRPDDRFQTGRDLIRELQRVDADFGPAGDTQEVQTVDEAGETEPVSAEPRPVRRRRLREWVGAHRPQVLFAASLLVALVVGGLVGWSRREPNVYPPRRMPPPAPKAARWEHIEKQGTAQKQYEHAMTFVEDPEAAWLAVIKLFPDQTEWVYRAQVQLGRHYLTERRLDDADRLFGEMQQSNDRRAITAGRVGHAAVLSLQGKPDESLTLLKEVISTGELGSEATVLGIMLHAFERNYRNKGMPGWDRDVEKWAQERLKQVRVPGLPRPLPGPPSGH